MSPLCFAGPLVFAVEEAPRAEGRCFGARVEVAAEGAILLPAEALSRTFDLPRARVGLAGAVGPASVRVRVGATRSADEESYIGIDGEAWVPTFDLAAAGLTGFGLHGEVGIVADPWVASGNRAWAVDTLAPTLAEEQAWIDASDLGLALRYTGFGDRLELVATATSGEGADRRERNEDKDVAGALSVAPTGTPVFVATAYVRAGSRGLAYSPQQRVGLRFSHRSSRVGAGVEAVAAWGVEGDATRAPVALSAWSDVAPIGPLFVAVRGDVWSEAVNREDALAWRVLGGVGARMDLGGARFTGLLGADHVSLGAAIAPFAGTPAAASSTRLFLHLGVDFGAQLELP